MEVKPPNPRQEHIDDWLRMYQSITDPEMREEAKRKEQRAQRLAAKRKDTGYGEIDTY